MDARLQRLVGCHSTPGDEDEVREVLEACWREEGWSAERYGAYAAVARGAPRAPDKPSLLVCAHMDSPGYSVDRLRVPSPAAPEAARFGVTELGAPEFDGATAPAVLKTRRGKFEGVLRKLADEEDDSAVCFEMDAAAAARCEVRHGDRVCFSPRHQRTGHVLESPFFDNRLGCWMLTRLAAEARAWQTRFQVVLGATANEELCGFGARVLASQLRPDLVVVLDATYASEEQGVWLGRGPVLTLSDASVLLSPLMRDRVLDCMARAGVPIQTEVYNFSGTDARAFPLQGLLCPVLPILVATCRNHSPRETADVRDFEAWLSAVRAIAENF